MNSLKYDIISKIVNNEDDIFSDILITFIIDSRIGITCENEYDTYCGEKNILHVFETKMYKRKNTNYNFVNNKYELSKSELQPFLEFFRSEGYVFSKINNGEDYCFYTIEIKK